MTIPVFANDHVELNMTLAGFALDDSTGGPPFFAVISDASGHVVINHIDVPGGTADILGLHVEFDLQVCTDSSCTQVLQTLHYVAQFDNTTGTATGDPGNLDAQFVTANPTSGRIHRSGGGAPDTDVLFAVFDYSSFPTLGYDVSFAFTAPEFNGDVILVSLAGPA
jgi:hypothetical protein